MRLAVGQSPRATEEYLRFAKQVGVRGVQFNTPEIPGEERWETSDLVRLVDQVAEYDLVVEAIENVPISFYADVLTGGPRKAEQRRNLARTIENIGAAGIPILGLHFLPMSVWRTHVGPLGRGGAMISAYDDAVAQDPDALDRIWVARRDTRADTKDSWQQGAHLATGTTTTNEAMWANFEYMLRDIVPAAEGAGVRLAFHPDDPPIETAGGMARILTSVDALDRALQLADSPAMGLDLCLGTISEMGGEAAVLEAIRRFGPAEKIVYVHLRDVAGTVPTFVECFLGEGNYSPAAVIDALAEVGFDGFILDDHTPGLAGDDAYGYRGRAHALGYLQALIDTLPARRAAKAGHT